MKTGIDQGHGGRDSGAIGPTRLYEKDITLDIGLRVEALTKLQGFEPVLTRRDDSTLDLFSRSNMLNGAKCDIAVSIHVNSSPDPKPNYLATFVQDFGGQAEKLAKCIHAELLKETEWPDGGIRKQNLHMTRETKMPAVLLELGFISNAVQEKQLQDPTFRQRLAEAIVLGMCVYKGVVHKSPAPAADPLAGTSDWAKEGVQWAAATGLLTDVSRPQDPVTREVLAVVLYRFFNLLIKVVKGELK